MFGNQFTNFFVQSQNAAYSATSAPSLTETATMAPKRSITYNKPEEPPFIKRMKNAVGYQEPDNVETKRGIANSSECDDDADHDRYDERPMLVVIDNSDITEEDVKKIVEKADLNQKITFARPATKKKEDKVSLAFSSKKNEKLQKEINNDERGIALKVKNTSLLSFDEDEDY
ncbi:DUF4604 domain-containing protein [Trichonephila clavata]|uniref:DUF4604 domain-containing protein n=1 Tax=Trichonephila clavata TaxID=2740835 RepID=A0A8X6JLC6_TRICU|nr:DUF4604 domain-containing protein [Trichonephila clavata]